MSGYKERIEKRERPQQEYPLPPIGCWVQSSSGARGQVVEHIVREGRPALARVQLRSGKFGTYQAHELTDIGGEG